MKCSSCGSDNSIGAKFCIKCGAKLTETTLNEASSQDASVNGVAVSKKISLKKISIFAVPIILLIAALIFIMPMLKNSKYSVINGSIMVFNDDKNVYVSINNKTKITIDGEYYSLEKSLDETKGILLTDYEISGGKLWFVNSSGHFKIDDDVIACKLADSGNGVIYLTDFDEKNYTATLYLYDVLSKKRVKIYDEVVCDGYDIAFTGCISPDGKSVAYSTYLDKDKDDLLGFIKINGGATKELGKNMSAIAISNGGKYIYYLRTTNDGDNRSLYVKSSKNDNKLASNLPEYPRIDLNKDYSQVIFSIGGKSYISRSGNEKEKVDDLEWLSVIKPRKTQKILKFDIFKTTIVYGIDSFANSFAGYYSSDDGDYKMLYINNKFEAERIPITSSLSGFYVTGNEKKMFFVNGANKLSVVDSSKLSAIKDNIAEDVKDVVISEDGKSIYYLNIYGELWFIKNNKKAVKISDGVLSQYYALSPDGNKLFFVTDYSDENGRELYYTDKGGKKTKVSGGNEIKNIWGTATGIAYQTYDNDIYMSTGDEKFTLFQREVND